MSGEKVSIAMTTYNGEKYLREQLDSLYSQTRLPDEIVAVDDGSADGTLDILEEYKRNYNLTYYANNKNLGIAKNFEKAIFLCHGDYIMICDQDDVWLPNKVEICLQKIREIEGGKPALVVSEAIPVNADLKRTCWLPKCDDSYYFMDTLFSRGWQGCCMMMNGKLKDLIIPIEHDVYDVYIATVAAMCGIKYNLSNELMYYRTHSDNAVGKITERNIPFLYAIKGYMRIVYRFSIASPIYDVFFKVAKTKKSDFGLEQAKYADKILHLFNAKNPLKKLTLIFALPHYSLLKKFELCFNSIIYRVAKRMRG